MVARPDEIKQWATSATGSDIVDPDDDTPGKSATGWVDDEIPPHEWFNYLQNNWSVMLAHIAENGVAEWNTVQSYPIGGIVKGSDSNLYRAIVAQSGNNPVGDGGVNWEDLIPADVPEPFLQQWDATYTYAANFIVGGTDGKIYKSSQGSNLGNTPIGDDGTWWTEVAPDPVVPKWSGVFTYAVNDLVAATDGKLYVSQAASNISHDPTTDTGAWWKEYAEDKLSVSSFDPNSTGNSGYIILPSGVIIQGGNHAPAGSNNAITLPIAFPTAGLFATVSQIKDSVPGSNQSSVSLGQSGGVTLNQTTIYITDSNLGVKGAFWIAIGY